MNWKKNFTFAFVLGLILMSCEETIDLDLEQDEPKLVIEGWITDDPGPYQVTIRRTIEFDEAGELPAVENASVIVTDDAGNRDSLVEVSPGVYETTSIQGVIGRTYTLNVDDRQGKTTVGQSLLPRINPIDTLVAIYDREFFSDNDSAWFVVFVAQEAPGVGDFYRFNFYQNDSLYDDINDLFVTDDRFSDGQLAFFQFPWGVNEGDTITIEVLSISEDAYQYYITLQSISNSAGNPFGAPPENPSNNLTNDALGFFGASGIRRKSIVIPQ